MNAAFAFITGLMFAGLSLMIHVFWGPAAAVSALGFFIGVTYMHATLKDEDA